MRRPTGGPNAWTSANLRGVWLLGVVFSLGCAHAPVPLPANLRIRSVSANRMIAPELASLSGKWTGRWDGTLDHVLVVERISTPGSIGVVWAWGTNLWIAKAGWVRREATFSDGELRVRAPLGGGGVASYRVRPDGSLDARYVLASPEFEHGWQKGQAGRGKTMTAVMQRTTDDSWAEAVTP